MDDINQKIADMCRAGLSDQAIGKLIGFTGEGVAYRRKKLGIDRHAKNTELNKAKNALFSTSKEQLSDDYYNLTQEQFSEKYHLSKTVWLPYLRSINIEDKYTHRIESYPEFTEQQRRLLIGSLLGDGGIDEHGRYYEFHSYKQETYLRKKHSILKPFSVDIGPESDGTGLSYRTVQHPQFVTLRSLFYKEGIAGKLIPLDYVKQNWHDSILAYWFFDDGYLDDASSECTISNKCPIREQLTDIAYFLEEQYHWGFYSTFTDSIYRLSFSKKYRKQFGELLLDYATPDLYYKIPEEALNKEHVQSIVIDGVGSVKPKFYRLADSSLKTKMEKIVFDHYRARGFPFIQCTQERLNYLLDTYKGVSAECLSDTIQHNTSGIQLCEYFFPNMYECRRKGFTKSPLEFWDDDDFLLKFVRNRLTYADRITDASMRTGVKLSKICVSNFKPTVAQFLYKRYAVNQNILDYSSGFGSRMLAAMSLGLNYVGYEPSSKTYENLCRFGKFLSKRTSGKYQIVKSGSELAPYVENFFGFAFSSPPYFDFEDYSADQGQSIVQYPDYHEWLTKFWKRVMENCYISIVPDGYFAVCLSPNIAPDLIKQTMIFAEQIGFYFEKDYRVLFRHVLGGGDKVELIMVFSKKPTGNSPRFVKKYEYVNEPVTDSAEIFLCSKEVKRRTIFLESDYKNAEVLFSKLAPTKGVSRETFSDRNILGVPTHAIERHYGSWNDFVRTCGLDPGYEAKNPRERVQEYFQACTSRGRVLSFYEFEKETGHPASRLKRLFNAGKTYAHLKNALFSVTLDPAQHASFLNNFR
jgi:hypothetical protein